MIREINVKTMNDKQQPPAKSIEQDLAEAGLLELAAEAGLDLKIPQQQALDSIITNDADTIKAKEKAIKLSRNHDLNVMIIGDTGTGKELFARVLHGNLPGPFIGINTAGIPDGLLESELFGCVSTAFTGAGNRVGLIEAANNGTLFLDEVGEMPTLLQSKLLRAIQEREFRRVGSNAIIKFNCKIVSATNRPEEQLRDGKHGFRQDLFFRLAKSIIKIKPLHQRGDDWMLLLKTFCQPLPPKEIIEQLKFVAWDGNIRELLNWIEEYKTLNTP